MEVSTVPLLPQQARREGSELTWLRGHPRSRVVCHYLLGLHCVPVLAAPAVRLGPCWWLPGTSGQLWCPLGGCAGRAGLTAAGYLLFFQVHEPYLPLQALLTTALLSLQGQAPIAPIRDLEGTGGRPPFTGPKGRRWQVGSQHGTAFPSRRRESPGPALSSCVDPRLLLGEPLLPLPVPSPSAESHSQGMVQLGGKSLCTCLGCLELLPGN